LPFEKKTGFLHSAFRNAASRRSLPPLGPAPWRPPYVILRKKTPNLDAMAAGGQSHRGTFERVVDGQIRQLQLTKALKEPLRISLLLSPQSQRILRLTARKTDKRQHWDIMQGWHGNRRRTLWAVLSCFRIFRNHFCAMCRGSRVVTAGRCGDSKLNRRASPPAVGFPMPPAPQLQPSAAQNVRASLITHSHFAGLPEALTPGPPAMPSN
jgi:hypothetical protein